MPSSPINTACAPSSSATPLIRLSPLPLFPTSLSHTSSNALDRIDKRFPVVKKPTEELYKDTRALILLLYHKGLEGKDHVFQDYSSEAKKNEQAGLVAHGKAAATTVLVVSNETLS
ncbi:hypothetical protein FOYG_11796 [Fusarium oxysporum NRRL 32931]|uniref:Uncharacterized protein n=1 Tax=Fusarium oxysporum NRRL 32931 TaxID=660029 RepID=W9I547_FUSOX|nr:hypothetical protein FOYG_11796 [Fusarium oxysporum NRRL 32931]